MCSITVLYTSEVMHSHEVTKNNTGGSDAIEFISTNCFFQFLFTETVSQKRKSNKKSTVRNDKQPDNLFVLFFLEGYRYMKN